MNGPKIAVSETASDSVFINNTLFTSKDTQVHQAIAASCDALNSTMFEFGYTQKLEPYHGHNIKSNRQKQPFLPTSYMSAIDVTLLLLTPTQHAYSSLPGWHHHIQHCSSAQSCHIVKSSLFTSLHHQDCFTL